MLVVDDEVGLALVLQDALDFEGYEVDICHDSDTAKELLSQRSYDIAVLDVYLTDEPGGIALGSYIMSKFPASKLFFMTGYAAESDIEAGLKSGAFTCIRKPFNLDDIIRVISTLAA